MRHSADHTTSHTLRNLVIGGVAVLATAIPAAAFAKETGVPTTGGGTATCSPITSLVVKADPKVAELGTASIAVGYSVKPCTNGQAVTTQVTVSEYLNPSVVVYDWQNAPADGKFTVYGVRVRVTYKVTVTVTDNATGALAGTQSAYVAAIPKSV